MVVAQVEVPESDVGSIEMVKEEGVLHLYFQNSILDTPPLPVLR